MPTAKKVWQDANHLPPSAASSRSHAIAMTISNQIKSFYSSLIRQMAAK